MNRSRNSALLTMTADDIAWMPSWTPLDDLPQPAPDTVTLKNGPTVPVDVLRLVWRLEHRGVVFAPNDRGGFRVTGRITTAERAVMNSSSDPILAVMRYVAELELRR